MNMFNQLFKEITPEEITDDAFTLVGVKKVDCCQSCGMPFDEGHIELIAKEPDGTDSIFCSFCYEDGKFLQPDATISDMVEVGVPHLARKIGEQAAREELSSLIPTLERWKINNLK